MVKEPEAAALFTIHHMGDKGLTTGDAIIVCDAGGGTVDLITYEVVNLKPFKLKEVVTADGKCLSTSVCLGSANFVVWMATQARIADSLPCRRPLRVDFHQSALQGLCRACRWQSGLRRTRKFRSFSGRDENIQRPYQTSFWSWREAVSKFEFPESKSQRQRKTTSDQRYARDTMVSRKRSSAYPIQKVYARR